MRLEDSGKVMFKAANLRGFDECTAYLEIAKEVKPSNCRFSFKILSFFFCEVTGSRFQSSPSLIRARYLSVSSRQQKLSGPSPILLLLKVELHGGF